MDTVITLNIALPEPVDDGVPAWIQLTPAGTFRGRDGRGPFTIDAEAVARASSALPAVIDEMHSTDLQGPVGGAAPARGWIMEMAARADGVWGRVDWTPEGRALVAGRSYRGVSPALASDKATGRVLRVLRAALTNAPNFEMTTLHSQQDPAMDLDKLRAALGLPATATEDDCLAAVTRAAQAVSTHAADLARLAAAAGAAKPDVAAIETVLAAARPATAEVTRLAAEVVSLNTQLATVLNGQKRDKAEAAIDAAIKAGKPITALREHYITRHMADPAGVELELGAMISLHSGGIPPRGGSAPKPGDLSDAEVEVMNRMGLNPDQVRAAREARQASGGRR